MAQLLVRKLSDQLVRRLKERAASHGRSAEEEHRVILQEQLLWNSSKKPKSLKQLLMAIPSVGSNADFKRRTDKPRKVRL